MISTRWLSKSYNGKLALQGLDLDVPRGAIYGFLGRNGAGKTTTLKLLLGMLRQDAGTIHLLGIPIHTEKDSVAARRRIAFVSEEKELYPFMNVGEMIRFTRPFYPNWRRDLEEKYLDLFRLPLKKSVTKLSKGMRGQLMMLLAMARGAELLIMDAFLATILDDVWRINAGVFGLVAMWMLQTRFPHAADFNPFAGMSLFSYPLTAAMPWAPVLTSVVAIAVLTWSSFLVLERKEY